MNITSSEEIDLVAHALLFCLEYPAHTPHLIVVQAHSNYVVVFVHMFGPNSKLG